MMWQTQTTIEYPFALRPASIEEAGLFYSQMDEAEDAVLGTVGHIRMDFGASGKEFYHTWWPHNGDQFNTGEFKDELQKFVDMLRSDGPLTNLASMRNYCYQHGGTPKATTPVQATAPKTMELPKGAPPKSQTNDVAPATPIEGKKPQKPPKAEDLKGKAEGAATTTPAEGKKSEEPPKATDPKGKAEGAAPAGPTEGKKPEEPPKATDPKGKAEGAAPAGPTEGKKPEEPPKDAG